MSLANYYRPKNFADVIGQEHITTILQAKVRQTRELEQSEPTKRVQQNYLFYGPRGTGKTSTARLFAKALNALQVDELMNPTLDDVNVKAIDAGTTLDYVEIDAASHTGVDNIREEILDKVPYPPTTLKKKVYVIDEVHMLSKGAFNALLKTIEEPRPYVCFILATTEIHKVPDTIISRCQVFNFKKVSEEKIVAHLSDIANKEGMTYEQEALELIATISEGCMRDAIKYLDQVSILGDITAQHVSQFLGVASDTAIQQFLDSVREKDENKLFNHIAQLQETGVDLYNFAKQLLVYIDKHLQEDTDFFLAVSHVCTDILSTIKYYPYPAIVYKLAFYRFLGKDGSVAAPTVQVPNPSVQKEQQHSPVTGDQENLDMLREKLLASIDKNIMRDNLTNNTVMDNIDDNILTIISMDTISDIMLQKAENIQYLEELLSKIRGSETKLHVMHEKKEEYFARKMMKQ